MIGIYNRKQKRKNVADSTDKSVVLNFKKMFHTNHLKESKNSYVNIMHYMTLYGTLTYKSSYSHARLILL